MVRTAGQIIDNFDNFLGDPQPSWALPNAVKRLDVGGWAQCACLRYSPAPCESLGVNRNEWISQIQGKETTQLCNNVIDMILLEIKKQKISNMADLNAKKLKEILKKLRMGRKPRICSSVRVCLKRTC